MATTEVLSEVIGSVWRVEKSQGDSVAEGEVIKEIYFTVGKDGEVIKPECQLKSANTLSSVTFARTVDKKLSDRKYDKKVGKKYGFEGRVTWAKECPPVN